jgi:hypothetical protein
MCSIVTWNEGCRPYDPPMPIQAEAPGEYLEPIMMNCMYKPDTEVSREQKRVISELFVPQYKKYETAYVSEKRQGNFFVGPVLIKHALLHPSCLLEMSLPFEPTIFTIWKNRRKKRRPGIVWYGMCCMRDLQLQWNHVSGFTGRVLHSWGTRYATNRMS